MSAPLASAELLPVASPEHPGHPLYLEGGVFGLYHAAGATRSSTAVLLVPPFGWEDVCSYRSRRTWAQRLAVDGHPALRLDLPGTADSAGAPEDDDLVAAWVDAVGAGARWLRQAASCPRVAVIGIGLGGLLACRAAATGTRIDDLVLWGVPAQGRRLVRELRAFSAMQAVAAPAGVAEVTLPEGALVANGYVLGAATVAALGAMDGTGVRADRALLLEREALGVDAALRGALEAAGVPVIVAPGPGWAAMMREPQESDVPYAAIDEVARFLAAAPAPPAAVAPDAPVGAGEVLELDVDGVGVRETPLSVVHERTGRRLFGVLCEPVGPTAELTAVLLNAGPQRHTGPNRMWTQTARRWAARGVPTFRVDLEAIGDADGDHTVYKDNEAMYAPELVDQARFVLDALAARGLPPRFLVQGLCSGASWGLRAAADDPRVVSTVMLNPQVLVPDQWTSVRRRLQGLLAQARKPTTWRRVLRGELTWSKHRATAVGLARHALRRPARAFGRLRSKRQEAPGAPPSRDPLDAMLDRLAERGQRLLVLFTGAEPLHREWIAHDRIAGLEQRRGVELLVCGTEVATHTLQPLWLQAQVNAVIDAELERVLRAG